MDFDGLLGVIIFFAIIGFNIIVPIVKGLKENKQVEDAHKSRPRPPQSGRPATAPIRPPAEPVTRMSGQDTARRSGNVFEKTIEPPTISSIPTHWEMPYELLRPPQLVEISQKQGKKKKQQAESQQEILKRLAKAKAQQHREDGEICDACYDEHDNESKYAAMLKEHNTLVNAIIASEILGKPLSMRGGEGGVFDSKF